MGHKLASGLVFLCCIGAGGGSFPPPKATPTTPPIRELTDNDARAALEALRRGRNLFFAMRYREAAGVYRTGLEIASRLNNKDLRVRLLVSLGNCSLAVQEYRAALRFYLEAGHIAATTADPELKLMIASNISALYLQLGDVNAGLHSIEHGLRILRNRAGSRFGPQLLLQAAALHARMGDLNAALPFFSKAIDLAHQTGDLSTVAFAWDQLGYELLQRGKLDSAEAALLEAFRLRRLHRLPDLQYSYYTLGMLRIAQRDLHSASRLLDEAVRLATRTPGTLPAWRIHYQRGRLRLLEGKPRQALADLQVFLQQARRIWVDVLTADSSRTSMEGELHQAYSTYIRAAGSLYHRTGRADLARRAFEEAEACRAVSLLARMSTPAGWHSRLPSEYWETLARLRTVDADSLRQETEESRRRTGYLLYRLTEMEAQAGLDLPSPSGDKRPMVNKLQQTLSPREAYVSFHLGEDGSCRWVVTRDGFEITALPPRGRVATLAQDFRAAVASQTPDALELGSRLYGMLFGGSARAVRHPEWLLALDDVLFEVPYPALVAGMAEGRPVYLIERRGLRYVPGASTLLTRRPGPFKGPFLGVSDPVYNTADLRWPGRVQPRGIQYANAIGRRLVALMPALFAAPESTPSTQLPRLVGSGREVQRCVRAWSPDGGGADLLEGMAASRQNLASALRRQPSVVHVAAHFLMSRQPHPQAVAALSLGSSGEPELLSPTEISRWNCPLGLVVLSGCASGRAATLPGAGLMGMTRAWLAAGARSVVASLWPAPDDTGELFVSFYCHLRRLSAAGRQGALGAEALRLAQLDMLRSRSWRSGAEYWASFFIVGKE